MKISGFASLILVFLFALGLAAEIARAQGTTSLEVNPGLIETHVGERFTVDIVVRDAVDLFMWQVSVYFDASILKCVDTRLPTPPIVPLPPFPNGFWYEVNNNAGRVVADWLAQSPWPSFTGTGTLFRLEFEALGVGYTAITIDPDTLNTYLLDSNLNQIPVPPVRILSGYVTVWSAIHDIAIIYVKPWKTVVFEGYELPIMVTVSNLGNVSEDFFVSTFYDGHLMVNSSASLTAGRAVVYVVSWMANVPKAIYHLNASVGGVPQDINVTNNAFDGGSFFVSMEGDLTGPAGVPDGKVDIRDVAYVAQWFGKIPIIQPNCDINNDQKVDIRDIATVAKNFGKVDP